MLKRLSFVFSMPFTGILLLILIVAMALATFVESAQGANTAWALIYDTWWFELLFVLVTANLIGSVFRNKLYKRSKLPVFVFHIAFIFIIVGGGITRYTSQDGMMRIREGGMSGSIVTSATYMDVLISDSQENLEFSKKTRLSPATPGKFSWRGHLNGKSIKLKSVEYMPNASVQVIQAAGGQPYMQLILLAGGQVRAGLFSGETKEYPGISLAFNNQAVNADLNVFSSDTGLFAFSEHPVVLSSMGGDANITYSPGDTIPVSVQKLFSLKGVRFALQDYIPSAKQQFVRAGEGNMGNGYDVTRLEVELDGMKAELFVQGMKGIVGEKATLRMGDTEIACAYGSHKEAIPFVLKLKDFKIDRYPGSHSPSSFESEVVLVDMEKGINEERRIFMNNVLKHRGYRFYQSSYDSDEQGTILSVKKDFLGTFITYAGYLLMTLGMILALFFKGTRFSGFLRTTLNKSAKLTSIITILAVSSLSLHAQEYPVPDKAQAREFGRIWTQGKDGRLKPMNTLSNEILRKVVKKSDLHGLSSDQVVLGMIMYPDEWDNIALFEVENAELQQLLGYKGTKVSFNDFIVQGRYILTDLVNAAYNKPVNVRNDLDKEVMKLDERINVFYMVQNAAMFTIFPDVNSEEGKWLAVSELFDEDHSVKDSLAQVFLLYRDALIEENVQLQEEILDFIYRYQEKNSIHPLHEGKKNLELFYNRVLLFERLSKIYLLFGFIMLIVNIMKLFKPARWKDFFIKVAIIHLAVAWVLHVAGFAIRWYVSGHAPLSNGYESMIFVSLVILFLGILLSRLSELVSALSAILAGLALLVAHMSWMNPDITNLVPVLKSPWLTIHVMVIMGGYAALGISMFLGMLNLGFYSGMNTRNRADLLVSISTLTRINHIVLIIGLYLLTIGTFLGGVWANESWGRYWGWDPKETWALISVLVYTFVSHQHRIPGLRGDFAFNLTSMWGFSSILMTYFGVNYFLGGIHSYGQGAAFQIPFWVYLLILSLFVLSLVSYTKNIKYNSEIIKEE